MTIWLYLALIFPICCVFAAGPSATARAHNARLVVAFAVVYVGLLLDATLAARHDSPGLAMVFAALLGWVPSIAYVGFLEAVWRRVHRRKIRVIEAFDTGRLSKTAAFVGICMLLAALIYFSAGVLTISLMGNGYS
jgi:hypothetical protein